MKMVCIKTKYSTGSGEYTNLTIGKTYDVVGGDDVMENYPGDYDGRMCHVVDDNGQDITCLISRFIPVKEHRNNKLIELIGD